MEGRLRVFLLNRARVRVLLLAGLIALGPAALAAEDETADDSAQAQATDEPIIQPDIERREIEEPEIDTEDFEAGVYAGFISVEDFSTEPLVGLRFAYHVSESLFVEATYGQATVGETSFERLTGIDLATDEERKLKYYNLSLGYNILPGESFLGETWAFNNAVYLVGGIGATRFFEDQRFTVNLGVGYRLLMTDWVAAHITMRDHMFNMDVLGEDKTTHNMELSGGITVFF